MAQQHIRSYFWWALQLPHPDSFSFFFFFFVWKITTPPGFNRSTVNLHAPTGRIHSTNTQCLPFARPNLFKASTRQYSSSKKKKKKSFHKREGDQLENTACPLLAPLDGYTPACYNLQNVFFFSLLSNNMAETLNLFGNLHLLILLAEKQKE